MTRTFIALEMNKAVQRHLTDVIHQVSSVLPSIRWVNPAGIHLTLAFLGELDDNQLQETIAAATTVAQETHSFSYRLTHPGSFGAARQPRVIWTGIEERSGTLLHVHARLQQDLARRGFSVDTRPFAPHLTLARIKAPLPVTELERLQAILHGGPQQFASRETFTAKAIAVMKSELLRSGAQYTPLKICPFSPT
ncbi:MAG TPA: RNA 2',3'-cyclic phosphodiesterase [Dictyobacter sp.]|jgi:2'-5' RNA ligase|nr:RNA 2',3'-cyclic phosphodiesterase [Dictyobacter sp.]